MKKLELLQADEILRASQPGAIFTGIDERTLSNEFRALAKRWHPDINRTPDAALVMAQLKKLYDAGCEMLQRGTWEIPGVVRLADKKANKEYRIHYLASRAFELGVMYISHSLVAYVLDPQHRDLFDNADGLLTIGFRYASPGMEGEVSRYLPRLMKAFETEDGRLCMVINKTPDLLLLQDVLAYYKGQIPDRHAAWIQSTLHNLVCYLEYAGLTHNDISPDTYFISPLHHCGALLGGWWYATETGNRIRKLNARSYRLLPPDIKAGRIADHRLDFELVRATGREMLGDITGVKLEAMHVAPKAMVDWLRFVSTGSAIEDYERWGDVLRDSFGPRRYVEMELTADKLYGTMY